jgi:hypothetical protein
LWAGEDLRAGGLATHRFVTVPAGSSFLIDLRGADPFQRFEAWYLDPLTAPAFIGGFAAANGRIVSQRQDLDLDRVRFLVAYVPFGA